MSNIGDWIRWLWKGAPTPEITVIQQRLEELELRVKAIEENARHRPDR